jgi:hypothetical protein
VKRTHYIFGVHITDRMKKAVDVQKLLTEYGCNIKTRIGLHEVTPDVCSMGGVLLLEMVGDQARIASLADGLTAIEGVEVQKIVFEHED